MKTIQNYLQEGNDKTEISLNGFGKFKKVTITYDKNYDKDTFKLDKALITKKIETALSIESKRLTNSSNISYDNLEINMFKEDINSIWTTNVFNNIAECVTIFNGVPKNWEPSFTEIKQIMPHLKVSSNNITFYSRIHDIIVEDQSILKVNLDLSKKIMSLTNIIPNKPFDVIKNSDLIMFKKTVKELKIPFNKIENVDKNGLYTNMEFIKTTKSSTHRSFQLDLEFDIDGDKLYNAIKGIIQK